MSRLHGRASTLDSAAGAEHACKVGRLIGYVLSVVDRTWSLTHVSQAGTSLLFKSVSYKATANF